MEVKAGGFLSVEDPGLVVSGTTYGLDLSSGAKAQLSGGTFTGNMAAIWTADGNYADLLQHGYAYFAPDGKPIPLENVKSATTVSVKKCTDHPYSYTPNADASTHSWTCPVCGESVPSEPCAFSFDINGTAACACCGHMIRIGVDLINADELVYNGTDKTANVTITVTLDESATLAKDADYTVFCSTRPDAGEITVTVTGLTYEGTFTKTYDVRKDEPKITWNSDSRVVDYNGSPVQRSDLLSLITINIKSSNTAYLSSNVELSYRKVGAADFTEGLPTNAGVYEIKASLPEQDNYTAGDYHVWYKVEETENYAGVLETEIQNVLIQSKSITPRVDVSPSSFVYDSSKKEPKITVKDGSNVIDDTQYTIDWGSSDCTSVGLHTVTITGAGKNYTFTTTKQIEIKEATQGALKITGMPSVVYYGDTITLDTIGGSGNGASMDTNRKRRPDIAERRSSCPQVGLKSQIAVDRSKTAHKGCLPLGG